MDEKQANEIWTILEDECGASTTGRDDFVLWATARGRIGKEFRFGGVFGVAGKVWLTRDQVYVTGMNHVEMSRIETNERDRMDDCLRKATQRLESLEQKGNADG